MKHFSGIENRKNIINLPFLSIHALRQQLFNKKEIQDWHAKLMQNEFAEYFSLFLVRLSLLTCYLVMDVKPHSLLLDKHLMLPENLKIKEKPFIKSR